MNKESKSRFVSYNVNKMTREQLKQCYIRDCNTYSGRGKKIKRLNPGDHLFIRHCNNEDLLIISAVHDEKGHTIVLADGTSLHFPINLGKLNLPLSIYSSPSSWYTPYFVKYQSGGNNSQWEIHIDAPSTSK